MNPVLTPQACDPIPHVSKSGRFDSTIPVISIKRLDSSDPTIRQREMEALEQALQIGFFGIEDSVVDVDILNKGYNAIKEFFDSSMELKNTINGKATHNQRGYVPGEIALGNKQADCKEFLHIGPKNNLWPKHMDLETPSMALHQELMYVTHPLLKAISLLLGQSEDFLSNTCSRADNLLRPLRYFPNPQNGLWAAAHTDLNLITILPHASAKGLEVELNGKWTPVEVPHDTFVVNVADLLEIYSNGRWKSCNHRVVPTEPNQGRESIVFFVTTANETIVAPLGSDEPQYPPVSRLDFLKLRIFSLGYLKGLNEAINEVVNGVFIDKIKAMVDSGKASESVNRWYSGFQNSVKMMNEEDVIQEETIKKVNELAPQTESVVAA